MNISIAEPSGTLTHQARIQGTVAAKEALPRDTDLPPIQQVEASQPEDRVELSAASKVLAALSDQADEGTELQLSPDKLRALVSG